MLLAEDLLLLLYDDESGKAVIESMKVELGLAGAVLLELAMEGRVTVAGPGEEVRRGRLYVSDPTPLDDPILDDALARLRDKAGKTPKSVLGTLKKGLRERLLDGLVDRRILEHEEHKMLGLFPTSRWPAADAAHEREVRQRLRDALVTGVDPDQRTAAVIALLVAVDSIPKVIRTDDKRAAKRRAKEIAEGAWAADAVKKAIQDVHGAVAAAIIASTAAGGAAGSS
jgi:hypothetical protein